MIRLSSSRVGSIRRRTSPRLLPVVGLGHPSMAVDTLTDTSMVVNMFP
jgi:hypothetical protein